jgi:hypothetical protein
LHSLRHCLAQWLKRRKSRQHPRSRLLLFYDELKDIAGFFLELRRQLFKVIEKIIVSIAQSFEDKLD